MNNADPVRQATAPAIPAGLGLVRLRRGVVLGGRMIGESDRTVHLVPLPAGAVPDHLTALCGLAITPGMADLLPALAGMPCPACLALAARGATG